MKSIVAEFCRSALADVANRPAAERADFYEYASMLLMDTHHEAGLAAINTAISLRQSESSQLLLTTLLSLSASPTKADGGVRAPL